MHLKALVTRDLKHPLAETQMEIKTEREKLRKRLEKWRNIQMEMMPEAYDASIEQSPSGIEEECLCLPSDLPWEGQTADAMAFQVEEGKLREGQAYDALRDVQNAVKTITALSDKKRKNARGQDANTRSMSYINEAQRRRDHHMAKYASARRAMIALRTISEDDPDGPFPPLSLEDTFMKSRQQGRKLGDSRRIDGQLWHRHGQTVGPSERPKDVDSEWQSDKEGEADGEESPVCKYDQHLFILVFWLLNIPLVRGTQMPKRKKGDVSFIA